jgi:hypothetical protein
MRRGEGMFLKKTTQPAIVGLEIADSLVSASEQDGGI